MDFSPFTPAIMENSLTECVWVGGFVMKKQSTHACKVFMNVMKGTNKNMPLVAVFVFILFHTRGNVFVELIKV